MTYINKKEEEDIDTIKEMDKGAISIYRTINNKEKQLLLHKNEILLYGELNMDNPDDVDIILDNENKLVGNYNKIYSNCDLKTGIVNPINGKILYSETFDVIKWMKYNLCLLGNPKRILIYKC